MNILEVSISDVIQDVTLQIRDELNKSTIAQYAECIEQLPPVVVFEMERKGKTRYLLADGYHRLAAHNQKGLDHIKAEVRQGTERDAWSYALSANCKHGLPLSRKEKRRAIEEMLKIHTERADTWISSDLGVDRKTVSKIRETLESGREIPYLEKLLGQDEKWYDRNRKPRTNGVIQTQPTESDQSPSTEESEPEEILPPPDPWENQIIHSDCTEWLANDETMYDLIVTDPPYGILDEAWEPDDLLGFTKKWLKVALPRLKATGRLYICFSQRYMLELKPIVEKLSGTFLTFGGVLIWNYRNVFNKKYDQFSYKPTYEPVFYWYGPEAGKLNYDTEWNEERGDVWSLAMPQSNYTDKKLHPAQKPLELIKGIVRTATRHGEYVLDPFGGSGTTAVASQELGRRWRVIEQDEKYIDIIRGRLKAYEG